MTGSVHGVAKSRDGATDTTMLIWKVINANPGITKEEIFLKVEHGIPVGYALRRFAAQSAAARAGQASDRLTLSARRFVLSHTLAHMRANGSIDRSPEGCYRVLREIKRYRGNPDAVDETGMLAAEHLNAAYALPKALAAIERVNPDRPRPTVDEWRAIVRVVKNARRASATP